MNTIPNCVACGAELEPPVRVPLTVYVKTLYRVAGQDYCRHHVIKAAVAAGIIFEVKPAPARWRLTGERPLPSMASSTSAEPAYAITLHQPGASLTAQGIKTAETRSWPAWPEFRTISIHRPATRRMTTAQGLAAQ